MHLLFFFGSRGATRNEDRGYAIINEGRPTVFIRNDILYVDPIESEQLVAVTAQEDLRVTITQEMLATPIIATSDNGYLTVGIVDNAPGTPLIWDEE